MSTHPKDDDDELPGNEPSQSAGGAVGFENDDEGDMGERGPSQSGGGSVG